jgi:hypothetical protein
VNHCKRCCASQSGRVHFICDTNTQTHKTTWCGGQQQRRVYWGRCVTCKAAVPLWPLLAAECAPDVPATPPPLLLTGRRCVRVMQNRPVCITKACCLTMYAVSAIGDLLCSATSTQNFLASKHVCMCCPHAAGSELLLLRCAAAAAAMLLCCVLAAGIYVMWACYNSSC